MKKNQVEKICVKCNNIFFVKASYADKAVYCSRECRKNRITKNCIICAKEFEVKISHNHIQTCGWDCTKLHKRKNVNFINDYYSKPEFGYILGLCIGDASISNKSFRLEVIDKEFVEKVKFCIEAITDLKDIEIKEINRKEERFRNTFYQLTIIRLDFVQKLLSYIPDKHTVDKVFNLSKDVQQEFLIGIFDSDGSIANTGQITLIKKNLSLLKELQKLFKIAFNIDVKIQDYSDKEYCSKIYIPREYSDIIKNKCIINRKKERI